MKYCCPKNRCKSPIGDIRFPGVFTCNKCNFKSVLLYEEFVAALSVQLVYGKWIWTLSNEKIPQFDNGVDELEEYFLYQIFNIELADGAIESMHPITSE